MNPQRTIRYEPARQGLVLRVHYNGKTLQTFLGKEEYDKLSSIDFEYLKECSYALIEHKLKEMS